jgi:histone acetyltransferase (RNA polymerase elongator complex component)
MLGERGDDTMSECKHGMRSGCVYCHARTTSPTTPPVAKRRTKATRLSEQMNDRMTTLKKRLRQIRGE